MRAPFRGRPEPGDPGWPRMGLEPLDQLGRGVLAHARLRSREQRPFIDALAQAGPVEHVAVRGRLGGSPLAVHLVAVLLLRILTSTPGPFAARRLARALVPVDRTPSWRSFGRYRHSDNYIDRILVPARWRFVIPGERAHTLPDLRPPAPRPPPACRPPASRRPGLPPLGVPAQLSHPDCPGPAARRIVDRYWRQVSVPN